MTWLRAMYWANVLVAGPVGLANMLAPEAARGLMGIPPGDPLVYGVSVGAIPLAFGLAGLFGLRYPLKAAPVLLLQALYKSLWLGGVLLPHALTGGVPPHALPLIGIFVFFVVGDLAAVPLPFVFGESTAEAREAT